MCSGEAIAGVIFDAYGTLLDVYAVEATAEALFPGKGPAIARLWRDKQIAYSQLRTLSGRYAPFWQITEDALDYACEFARVRLAPDARENLLRQVPARFPRIRRCVPLSIRSSNEASSSPSSRTGTRRC